MVQVKVLILTVLLISVSSAHAQNFEWAVKQGGTSGDGIEDIVVDAHGNVYSIGTFNGFVDFDPGPGTAFLSSTLSAVFISKFDASGNFIWVKGLDASGDEDGRAIGIDNEGNIYLSGNFRGSGDYDPGPEIFNLSSSGDQDVFVTKLDSLGDFLWARNFGGAAREDAYSLTIDESNNVYITGYFEGEADFDPSEEVFIMTSNGDRDIFVCKLDSDGNFIWARQTGGEDDDEGKAIVFDGQNSIYVTGYFEDTVDFDPSSNIFNLISNGGDDIFIQKLSTSGDFIWARSIGGLSNDNGNAIVVDADDNVYITGSFRGAVDFDPGFGVEVFFSFGGIQDVFVLKLNSTGEYVWSKQFGAAEREDNKNENA